MKKAYTIFYKYIDRHGGGNGFMTNILVTRKRNTPLDIVALNTFVEKTLKDEKKIYDPFKVVITNIIDEYKI